MGRAPAHSREDGAHDRAELGARDGLVGVEVQLLVDPLEDVTCAVLLSNARWQPEELAHRGLPLQRLDQLRPGETPIVVAVDQPESRVQPLIIHGLARSTIRPRRRRRQWQRDQLWTPSRGSWLRRSALSAARRRQWGRRRQ